MPFKTTLEAALAHLKSKGIIRRDSDIMEPMGIKSKGTVSSYASGAHQMSKGFKEKFENYYKVRLSDFEPLVGEADIIVQDRDKNIRALLEVKKPPSTGDEGYKEKYMASLEKIIDQQQALIRALEVRLTAAEQSLSEVRQNQLVSYSVQFAFQEYWVEHFVKGENNQERALETIGEKALSSLRKFREEGIHL